MDDISLCRGFSTQPVLTVTSLKSKISYLIISIAKITWVPKILASFVFSDIMKDDRVR